MIALPYSSVMTPNVVPLMVRMNVAILTPLVCLFVGVYAEITSFVARFVIKYHHCDCDRHHEFESGKDPLRVVLEGIWHCH